MQNFTPLHVHSHYSLLDGLAKIDQIVEKSKKVGFDSCALTDHGVMYGAIEFYKKCKKAGIKPIIGCEVYIAPRTMDDKQPKIDAHPHHLVLLVKDMEGYKNLIKLVSASHLRGFYYKPRVDKELLSKYAKGLIALTACLNGEIPKLIRASRYDQALEACQYYIDTFGAENIFLEIQHHPELPDQQIVNDGLVRLSKETGLGLVCSNDSHYLNHDDNYAHEVLLSVQTGKDMDDQSRFSMSKTDLSFIEPEKAQEYFKDFPEAISNTKKIADMCNLELTLGENILPQFDVPDGLSAMEYLTKLAKLGFEKLYSDSDEIAKKRLDYEISVIEKTGFADYFLIVQDFINWSKNNGIIVGPGRGSAAGSIISYCLNITTIEPIRYGLLFERFLNPDRISMPDIDVDFADDGRDAVIEYVKNKYGESHVAQIITFGTMAARGSVRDTARAFGMSYGDGDRISKLIPTGFTIQQSLDEVSELKQIYNCEPEMKKLIDMAKKLEGVARHASTHACGVVISKEELTEYLPLQQATKGSTSITTQYPMFDVEAIGLLKMDFLGLSNLTIMKNALRIIKKIHNVEIDINKLPDDDEKTFKLLSKGETTGVFQLESDGMKRYIKELKPNKFEDIMVMVALYRPGPMQFIPTYINRKFGKEKVKYLHPKLQNALEETYGIPVYQEQVMRASRDLAGFTGGEADTLRKAIGKKIAALMAEVKIKFVKGCQTANNIDDITANEIWQLFEDFAAYGFNKSHACCYAFIAYQTAYLKANYPIEYMAALLTSDFGNLDRIAIEIAECSRMGVKVMSPNVNTSFVEFGVDPKTNNILFGFSAIKNVGIGASESIVENRKKDGEFKSVEDFINRLGPDVVNKKTMEALIKSGALDCLVERNQGLANLDLILKFAANTNKMKQNGLQSLFGDMPSSDVSQSLRLADAEPASKKQCLSWERELLGIYLNEHPMDEVFRIIQGQFTPIKEIDTSIKKEVKIAGVISTLQKVITKNKEVMFFAQIEDSAGRIEALIFPKVVKENPSIWRIDNIVAIRGKINNKDGVEKLIVEKAKEIDIDKIKAGLSEMGPDSLGESYADNASNEILQITVKDGSDKDTLLKIKDIITRSTGDNIVEILIPLAYGNYKKIPVKHQVKKDETLINELKKIDGLIIK
jgi:DNA polymerase-3 subunit alpha